MTEICWLNKGEENYRANDFVSELSSSLVCESCATCSIDLLSIEYLS